MKQAAGRRKPDIYWEIVDNPPVEGRLERHVLQILAKRQSDTNKPVEVTPQELARTGFSAQQAWRVLERLVTEGHIRQDRQGRFLVNYPWRHNRWLWEKGG